MLFFLDSLQISQERVSLQCVFHSIRFKVNKGWSTAVLLFLCPYVTNVSNGFKKKARIINTILARQSLFKTTFYLTITSCFLGQCIFSLLPDSNNLHNSMVHLFRSHVAMSRWSASAHNLDCCLLPISSRTRKDFSG